MHDTDVVAECMRVLLEAAAGLLVPSLSPMQAVNLVCACTFLYLSHSGGDLWSSEDGLLKGVYGGAQLRAIGALSMGSSW